ncbi:hypothetical protein F4804DRAFT_328539, partial [Jackrogersella minutella]
LYLVVFSPLLVKGRALCPKSVKTTFGIEVVVDGLLPKWNDQTSVQFLFPDRFGESPDACLQDKLGTESEEVVTRLHDQLMKFMTSRRCHVWVTVTGS